MPEGEEGAAPAPAKEGGAPGGSFIQKLKKAPPWVWIGLGVALLTLIVGWLAYQHSVSQGLPQPGQPGSQGPGGPKLPSGSTGGGNWATQQEFQQLQQEIQSLQQGIHGHKAKMA